MADASTWLVEIGAHTGSAVNVLRYSVGGYTTRPTDGPANMLYADRVTSLGRFVSHLFGRGRTIGLAEVSMAEVVLANVDRRLDEILDQGVDGRTMSLRRLRGPREAFSSAELVLQATAEQIDRGAALTEVRLRFYDRRRLIDKPIQTNRYGGTVNGTSNSADGSADLKGQLKPLIFGRVLNMAPVLANPYDLILQVNDGPVSAIALYDGGAALGNAGDFGTLAALRAADISPGRYGTCLALGLCRPGGAINGRPGHIWTADVTEGATVGQRSAGPIVQRMLARMGVTAGDIAAPSFAALASAAPQEVGICITNETSGLTVMRQVLDSVGGAIVPTRLGQFAVYQFAAPAAPSVVLLPSDILTEVATIVVAANPDTDGNLPASAVRLSWGRNWSPVSDSEIAICAASRAPFLKQEWRDVVASNAAVLTKHMLAPELAFETLLLSEADAQAEAARRLGLYGQTRLVVSFSVDRVLAETLPLNATVQMAPIGAGLDRPMVVIGREENFGDETVELTLWG